MLEGLLMSIFGNRRRKTKNMFARAVTNLYNTSNKPEFGRQEFSFAISDETMNYYEAAGWCVLQDMWLAELNGPHRNVLINNVSKESVNFNQRKIGKSLINFSSVARNGT